MKRIYASSKEAQDHLDMSRKSIISHVEKLLPRMKRQSDSVDEVSLAHSVASKFWSIFPAHLIGEIVEVREYGEDGSIDPVLTQMNLFEVFIQDALSATAFPYQGTRKAILIIEGGILSIEDVVPTWDISHEK